MISFLAKGICVGHMEKKDNNKNFKKLIVVLIDPRNYFLTPPQHLKIICILAKKLKLVDSILKICDFY